MEIQTNVISTEIIKPSSPTPKSMRKHQLSLIDQVAPNIMGPIVYFYSSNPEISNSDKTIRLKKSLSETLTTFYPVAGRLVDNHHVDCNDGGVPFVEAAANCDLSQVITNPDMSTIRKSLFCKLDGSTSFLVAVQVTHFQCGGLAVAVLISHKIADALALIMFVNAWSAAARRDAAAVPPPKFDSAAYFPPADIPAMDLSEEGLVAKTFTFSTAKIALLQERYTAAGGRRPQRVEALTAYICKRLASANGIRPDPDKIYFLNQPVNLRTRVNPPTLKHHFGNIMWVATATPTTADGGADIVRKIRQAGKSVFEWSMPELKDLNEMAVALKGNDGVAIASFTISSMCGFPVYGADFGWGKPVRVSFPGLPMRNMASFADTRSGDGIEVVVCLRKQDTERFEVGLEAPNPIFKSNL